MGLMPKFQCPQCRAPLPCPSVEGGFTCDLCQMSYELTHQPVFDFSGSVHKNAAETRSANNWAVQFGEKFRVTKHQLLARDGFWGQESFFKYSGLEPTQIAGLDILVVCGGSGREAWHCLTAGAKSVCILDLGDHLYSLSTLLADFEGRFTLVKGDATTLPFADCQFDICLCDHALQHIPNHKKAFSELNRCCKPGGMVSICVYSYENNFLMTKLVEPSKFILHKLPLKALWILSVLPALLVYVYHQTQRISVRVFQTKSFKEKMLFFDLFSCWHEHGFSKFWEACFDLIHAPVSYHFRKSEVESLAISNDLEISSLEMTNQSMWTLVCRRGEASNSFGSNGN